MLQQVYEEDCCDAWYPRLRSAGTSIEESPKSGRLSTSTDKGHVEKARAVIRKNRRLTVREVPEEVGICKRSCHTILTEKLNMSRVLPAKICPASADR